MQQTHFYELVLVAGWDGVETDHLPLASTCRVHRHIFHTTKDGDPFEWTGTQERCKLAPGMSPHHCLGWVHPEVFPLVRALSPDELCLAFSISSHGFVCDNVCSQCWSAVVSFPEEIGWRPHARHAHLRTMKHIGMKMRRLSHELPHVSEVTVLK